MSVRRYKSQHESVSELPLVTKSATVVGVDQMDEDRRAELRRAVARWLEERGLAEDHPLPERPAEWSALVDDLAREGRAALARRVAAVRERAERPKPMLVRVRFRTESGLDYLAGQYVGLRYGGNARAYSLASSPTRDELEVCVRRVPGGRLSPRICEDLTPNDELTVRGPHGELVLQDVSTRDMVFLATGTGVAPFKGMIDYVFDAGYDEVDGERRDVWLFLGAAWEDDLPYREEFRALDAERENFHFVPCLSRESYLGDWDGETDYVQHALLKHVDDDVTAPLGAGLDARLQRAPDSGVSARIDPSSAEVYACGINAMVYSLVEAVERLGVPGDRIESEGFG
ncbi:MAG: FAD-binding oxidoreductase [Halobacteriaceae archaeon]